MEFLYTAAPFNFLGLTKAEADFKTAKFVVIPVPFDATASYRSGARFGPAAIIEASRQVELFDLESKREPYEVGIVTMDEIAPVRGSPEQTVQRVKETVQEIIKLKKIPIILGGEHTVALGSINAFDKDVVVVTIDAHADLRNEYEGSKVSHACIMRRVLQSNKKIFQLGVRSLDKKEFELIKKEKNIEVAFMQDILSKGLKPSLKKLAGFCKNKRVYFSLDIDGIDPGDAPGTGTPEPDGLKYGEVLDIMRTVTENAKEVVGFDVVEVAPTNNDVITEYMAAKLIYKMISYIKWK